MSRVFQCYSRSLCASDHSASNLAAQSIRSDLISFSNYLKQLSKFVFTSSVVLGFIVGVSLLAAGETTMEIDLTFEFGRFDGVWFILGIPIVSILVFVILSPLSFLVHRQLSKRRAKDVLRDA